MGSSYSRYLETLSQRAPRARGTLVPTANPNQRHYLFQSQSAFSFSTDLLALDNSLLSALNGMPGVSLPNHYNPNGMMERLSAHSFVEVTFGAGWDFSSSGADMSLDGDGNRITEFSTLTFSLGLGNGPIVGYAAEGLYAQGRWEGLLGASVSVETASRNARIGRLGGWGGGGVAALDGGHKVNIKRIRRLMRLMGLMPIYQKPNTSRLNKAHKIYPYLLRRLNITQANHVWCADITYIPTHKGFLYLVAIMDWATRKVLLWRLSNTMEAVFCVETLNEAITRFDPPRIFNTDQGSQFTSWQWIETLKSAGIKISMDGKGRFLDNIFIERLFIERLWRSLKYECVYLHAWSGGSEAKAGIGRWIKFYNTQRPHKSHCGQTPYVAYWQNRNERNYDWSDKSVA